MKNFIFLLFLSFVFTVQAHDGEIHDSAATRPTQVMTKPQKTAEKSHMGHAMMMSKDMPASTQDFLAANMTMHHNMKFEYTGNPNIDFVRGMIPHHQGAIDMAHVLLAHARTGNVKQFAQRVIREQTKEINSMTEHLRRLETAWESSSQKIRNTESIIGLKRADRLMHRAMNIEFSGNPNMDFIRGMIPHHQGAIDMAAVVLQHGTDNNVRTLAWQIVNAQDAEIYWMRSWLRKLRW